MKYSIEWLKKKVAQEETIKYLFFWGHTAKSSGTVDKACFSQWWPSAFTIDGITYNTAEHWMMAEKARLFNDTEIAERIHTVRTPAEAKKLGRMVRNFDAAVWEREAYGIVKQGNLHKFSQHPELKQFLVQTGERVLVEASPVDFIWGIGLAQDDPRALDPEKWRGPNWLGFALMEVREELI